MSAKQKKYLRELKSEEIDRKQFEDFVKTHVEYVEIRAWLCPGSIVINRTVNQKIIFGLYLNAITTEPHTRDLTETVHHELIHMFLHVSGIRKHKEDEVERLCIIFADKYPFILEVLQDAFPGLIFSTEYFNKAFRQPVRIYRPTF